MVKKDWQQQTHQRAALVFDQMAKARRLAEEAIRHQWPEAPVNVDDFMAETPYMAMLDKMYGEDFQLARLMDRSDLIFHAEGPAAADAMPKLKAVNWLCHGVDRNLRRLAEAVLQLHSEIADKLAKQLDFRLTGMAPGSLYMGFALVPSEEMQNGLLATEDEPAFAMIREAICALPTVPGYIRDEDIDAEIMDAMPDPALRDASLTASFYLAPTGKMGIHTLEIGRPSERFSTLSNRERVVLREVAIKRPMMSNQQRGTFVGELREIDLDANRFHLRNVPNIGSLRCFMPIKVEKIRQLIGCGIKVEGFYETDKTGRPRLMRVESFEPYQTQKVL